jgi:O-antigen/teichoic acid export membrane protein
MLKNNYLKHRNIVHNFFWRASQIFGKQGITFLIFILVARILTPYDFGIYNYLLTIIFFLIMFGDFGISTATSKYVAEYNITDKGKLRSVLFNSGIIILSLTIIISLITIFFGKPYLDDKYTYVLYLLPLIFLIPITALYDGIYKGLKKFKRLSIISLSTGLFSLSFIYIIIKQYGIIGALVSQSLFYFVLFLALALGYRDFNFKLNKKIIRSISYYSLIIGISSLGFFLYTRIGVLILGHYGYIVEIGYYEIINKIFLLIAAPFTILGQVISPDITEYTSKKNYKKVKIKFVKYLSASIFLGIVLSLLIYFTLPSIMAIFLPEYLNPSFLKMLIPLLFILPLTATSGLLSHGFIVSTGLAKYSLLTIPFGILNLILSLIFIVNFGYIGVIYATVISSTLTRVLTYYLLYRNMRLLSSTKPL